MDLRQIEHFLVLAETLNFSRAAERLGITQPALSKSIKRLEDDLGGLLLHRDGKDTRLTELGRSIRRELENVVANIDKARQIVSIISGGNGNELNIGIATTLGTSYTIEFLLGAVKAHPGLRMFLHEAETTELPDLLLSGALDCCICSDQVSNSPKIHVVPLFSERLVLAVGSSHPFALQDTVEIEQLRDVDYLDRLDCEFRLSAAKLLRDQGVVLRSNIQSNREEWIQRLIAANIGVALMPEFSLRVEGIVLRPVVGLELAREVQFVSVSGPPPSRAVETLRRLAIDFKWPQRDATRNGRRPRDGDNR